MNTPSDPNVWREAEITINGQSLTFAQAMVMRVALSSFLSELRENGLGNDEHGKAMTAAYLARGNEVMRVMNDNSASRNVSPVSIV